MPKSETFSMPHFREVVKLCEVCGGQLTLNNSRDVKRKRFCSHECNGKYQASLLKTDPEWMAAIKAHLTGPLRNHPGKAHHGVNHPKWKGGKEKCVCAHCGINFLGVRADSKRKSAKFCSKNCYYIAGANRVVNTKSKVPISCVVCGKKMSVKPFRARVQKTCSARCSAILAVKSLQHRNRRTNIELVIRKMLDELCIVYSEQVPINRVTVVDFLVGKIAIYADGDYWHSRPGASEKDARIDSVLKKRGYTVLRFLGSLIETNPNFVKSKIKDICLHQNLLVNNAFSAHNSTKSNTAASPRRA